MDQGHETENHPSHYGTLLMVLLAVREEPGANKGCLVSLKLGETIKLRGLGPTIGALLSRDTACFIQNHMHF
jgi:hypothetical protein